MVVYILVALSYFALFFCPSVYSLGLLGFFILLLLSLFINERYTHYVLIFALIYLFMSISIKESSLSLGFEKDEIRGVVGDIISTPSPRGQRRYGYRVKLLAAEDSYGTVVTSKGCVYVLSDLTDAALGDRVRLCGTFYDSVFIANSTDYLVRTNRVRSKVSYFLSSKLKGNEGELTSLLLLGVGSSGNSDIAQKARSAGLSHIIALSGMHLSILSSILMKLLFFVESKRAKKAISYIPLFLFVYLSGWRPSLLRAFIFKVALDTTDSDIAFFLSDVVLLALFPYHTEDLGLIYSFLAFSGIMILSPYLSHALRALAIPKAISESVATTLAALSFSIPVSYRVFSSYQLSAIITSEAVAILIMLYMYISIASLFIPKADIILHYLYIAIERLFYLGALVKECTSIYPYLVLLSSVVGLLFIYLISTRKANAISFYLCV